MSISQISSYSQSVNALASLKENERLQTNGRNITKLSSPDRFLKTASNPLKKLVHKVVTFVIKFFQAIFRYLKNECSAINLLRIESLANEMKEVLKGSIPDKSEEQFYPTLKSLGFLRDGFNRSVKSGLRNYRNTLLHGEAECISEKYIERALQADRVDGLIAEISDEILPQVEKMIACMENEVYEFDLERFEQFYTSLSNKREVDFDSKFCSRAVLELLSEKFGKGTIEQARRFYHLENHLTLRGKDCIALINGAAANLTIENLYEVYPDLEYRSEQEIAEQLIDFRHRSLEMIPITDFKKRYRRQSSHDQYLAQVFNVLEDWNGEANHLPVSGLKKFSYAEYLARHIVYALFDQSGTRFSDGMLIPIYDVENTLRLFSAHELVNESGLHGILLKPVYQKEDQANKTYVVFRGTYCKNSIFRDLSPTERMYSLFDGPGRYSFTQHQESIYQKISSQINQIPNATLEFIGHSLGAADAMRAIEYFLYSEAQNQNVPHICRLDLSVFNAPSIEPDIARRFLDKVKEMPFEVHLRYFDVHHDPVQRLGSTRLGYLPASETYPVNLDVSVFKFNRGVEERVIALAKNILKRFQFFIGKSLEAHTFDCLRLHDTDNLEKLNSTFIQDIITNNPAYVGIQHGQFLERTSTLSNDDEINDELLTALCVAGRKMRRGALLAKSTVIQSFSWKRRSA